MVGGRIPWNSAWSLTQASHSAPIRIVSGKKRNARPVWVVSVDTNILPLFWAPTKNIYKHTKGSKERYLLGQNTTSEFSGWSPFNASSHSCFKFLKILWSISSLFSKKYAICNQLWQWSEEGCGKQMARVCHKHRMGLDMASDWQQERERGPDPLGRQRSTTHWPDRSFQHAWWVWKDSESPESPSTGRRRRVLRVLKAQPIRGNHQQLGIHFTGQWRPESSLSQAVGSLKAGPIGNVRYRIPPGNKIKWIRV